MAKRQKDIWTVTRLKTYQICPFKEVLRYHEKLALVRGRAALAFGTAIHKGLETRDIDLALNLLINDYPKTQEEADEQDQAYVTVKALLEGYFNRYEPFKEHKPEYQFELPMMTGKGKSTTLAIAGKVDDLVKIDGRWWIVEYKTASRLDGSYFDRLYVDSQITMYMYAMQRLGFNPAGVIYRVIRKPSIRRKQNETNDAFCERLLKDINERPDFYFMERQLFRDTKDLKEFEHTLYLEAMQERNMRKKGNAFRHTVSCSMYGACEYLPICTKEVGAMEALESNVQVKQSLKKVLKD